MPAARKKMTSIYDLAKEAGVSYATVSRILNGRGNSSEEARRKVLAAAKAFNFKPKMQARRTTVSLLFGQHDESFMENEYLLRLLGTTIRQLALHDVAVEFYSHINLSSMRTAMLDGVIGLPWDQTSKDMMVSMSGQMPCVTVNTRVSDSVSSVMSDHYQSGALAAQHLLSKGHQLASCAVHDLHDYGNTERVRGFVDTYSRAGVVIPRQIIFENVSSNGIMAAIDKTLNAGVKAIFVGGERAVEFAMTARLMRIKVPEDISVIVMEASNDAKNQVPAYTAIKQPIDRVAAKAVEMLLRKISEPEEAGSEQFLIPENRLTERDSVLCLKAADAFAWQQLAFASVAQ